MGWKNINAKTNLTYFVRSKTTDQYSFIKIGDVVENTEDDRVQKEGYTTFRLEEGIFKGSLTHLNSSEEVLLQAGEYEWRLIAPLRYTSKYGNVCKLSPVRLCIPMPQNDFDQINNLA
jgi:hypothetical protein